MIKSMTGFGRSDYEGNGRSIIIEIKSVNHRYNDFNIRLPRALVSLEDRIRKIIKQKINRGKVDVFITINKYERNDIKAALNKSLADSYFECLKEIKKTFPVQDDISVSIVARFPEVVTLEYKEDDVEEIWTDLQVTLNRALDMHIDMRINEGKKLKEDILLRCDIIKENIDLIEKRSPEIIIEYKNKLTERLKELLQDTEIDDTRIAMETAILSDKIGIDEEIVRLNSHINQMRQTLNKNEPVGRKLDFIVQEMNRETNTIGSKANDLETINLVLNIKTEIEKIREQIQNIE